MARLARVVAPGYPSRRAGMTQRGNRRMQTFFGDEDDEAFVKKIAALLDRDLMLEKPGRKPKAEK